MGGRQHLVEELGLFVLYQNGGVDKNVRASVIRLCPAYDRVSPVFRRALSAGEVEIEDEADSSHAVTKTKARASQEKKVCTEEDERRHRQELFECEFGAKKVQADVDIVCAKVLGRQKLLDAGVAPDEVDRVLPPSSCVSVEELVDAGAGIVSIHVALG
ncbi:hypothetical protein PI124_g23833 [Phytophthora idaei]|nr:hypothetical protein PI125_g26092 [Phytophthora idaei]KAG3123007.1 hypothetical protein PI126_g23893 [Phytophthora idaei]KAG3231071.1 hypothetical protein PI124_g23833 [Phytophthora idaei]